MSMLQIREDTKKGVYVENLKEIEVTSARDVIQQLIQVYNTFIIIFFYSYITFIICSFINAASIFYSNVVLSNIWRV